MVCQMLGAVDEFELAMNHERTATALRARRARGIKGGRPAKLTAEQVDRAERMLATGDLTMAEVAASFGVARSTLGAHRSRRAASR